ncbi:hypothetical protein BDN72DRAFT_857920 [Pluteus cervinus]|uniref:Uncharacterized protein n=1 Tax=Pluteus cervinus TaxID=181527 RepID=A0ACD3AUC3_9AGAR|nr:hypothetical protein BDN72DRAFT_857920 [Pluteus cervinus]
MEREMYWEFLIDTAMLGGLKDKVSQDFSSNKQPNQYPKYDVAMVSKRSACIQSSQSAAPLPDPISPIALPRQRQAREAGWNDPLHQLEWKRDMITMWQKDGLEAVLKLPAFEERVKWTYW